MVALSTHCSGGICSIPMPIPLRNITTFALHFTRRPPHRVADFVPKSEDPLLEQTNKVARKNR
jgi:hypothetical protein